MVLRWCRLVHFHLLQQMKLWIDQNIENNIPTAFFVALIIIYSNKNPFNHCYLCFWIVLIPRRMSYLLGVFWVLPCSKERNCHLHWWIFIGGYGYKIWQILRNWYSHHESVWKYLKVLRLIWFFYSWFYKFYSSEHIHMCSQWGFFCIFINFIFTNMEEVGSKIRQNKPVMIFTDLPQ